MPSLLWLHPDSTVEQDVRSITVGLCHPEILGFWGDTPKITDLDPGFLADVLHTHTTSFRMNTICAAVIAGLSYSGCFPFYYTWRFTMESGLGV
jgi:hypothetical protein